MASGNSVKFSPINDSVAVTTNYTPIHRSCLTAYSPELHPICSFIAPSHHFRDCSWSSTNPNLIIVATNGGGSSLIDISQDDKNPCQSFLRDNDSHTLSIDWHPNSESFLSASSDGTVSQWFIDQSIPQHTNNHPNDVSCVAWNPRDTNWYASTCYDGNLRIWDIRNGNAGITIKAGDSRLLSCDWNWHGKTCIATATLNRKYIKVWDITQHNYPIKVLDGIHTAGVCRVKFSPHREYQIASSSFDHCVVLWDYGQEDADPRFTRYEPHRAEVLGLDMSKRVEGRLASCGADGLVYVWQHVVPEA